MFEHFKAAALKSGKLIPFTFYNLPGEPRVLIEHLGATNPTFAADQIAKANVEETKSKRKKKVTEASLAEQRVQNRKTVGDHVIRKLDDVKHSDGTQATDADLAAFVASIPDDCITDVLIMAVDKENFREVEGDVEQIAKK